MSSDRKRAYSSRKRSSSKTSDAAKEAVKVVMKKLKRGVDQERKITQTSHASALLGTTVAGSEIDGTGGHILRVTQGDDDNQCIGRKYRVHHVRFKGIVNSGATATRLVRVIFYRDKRTGQAQKPAEDVLEPSANLMCQYLTNHYTPSITFLMDKVFVLPPDNPAAYFDKQMKLEFDVHTTSATGSLVDTIVDNSLHCIAYASGSDCYFEYTVQAEFTG